MESAKPEGGTEVVPPAESREVQLPWLRSDLLPVKPADGPYGYAAGRERKGCSQEELIKRCRSGDLPRIGLVWTPDAERLVPVEEVPFLHEAIRERTRRSLRSSITFSVIALALYGLPILASGSGNQRRIEYQLLLLLSFAVLPLLQGGWQLWQLRRFTAEQMAAEAPSARYGIWMARRPKPVTKLLLGVLIAVFLLQLYGGLSESVQKAGLTKVGLHLSDAYRFVTATLMHGSIPHILMNGITFLVLGMVVEALLGSAAVGLVFLISALGGSALSFLCTAQTSVGASGGIMGLIGCLAVLGFHFRSILPPGFGFQMIKSILLVAFTGYMARHVIDNSAHGGGLVAGAAVGWLLIRSKPGIPIALSPAVRGLGWLSLGGVIAAAGWIAYLLLH